MSANGATKIVEDQGLMASTHSIKAPAEALAPGEWTVDRALQSFQIDRPTTTPTTPLSFFHLLERLKTTPREGWRRFNIHNGESISDHMYRMSIITMLAPPSVRARVDIARCTKMALVHDMAEALVGDITPVDGVSKTEKSRREAETMDYLTGVLLGSRSGSIGSSSSSNGTSSTSAHDVKHLVENTISNGTDATAPALTERQRESQATMAAAGDDIRAVWQEYEDSVTPEAQFVHDVDKIELLLQMGEYERSSDGSLDLSEFEHVAQRLSLPEMREWADALHEERLSVIQRRRQHH